MLHSSAGGLLNSGLLQAQVEAAKAAAGQLSPEVAAQLVELRQQASDLRAERGRLHEELGRLQEALSKTLESGAFDSMTATQTLSKCMSLQSSSV